MEKWRERFVTAALAVVVASLVASAPAIASAVADYARNADKVDDRHAVGASTSKSERAGKIVATNRSGVLPKNILKIAPNSDRLQGFRAAQLVRASYKETAGEFDDFSAPEFTSIHGARASAPVAGVLMIWGQFSAERDYYDSPAGSHAGIASRVIVDGRPVGQTQFTEVSSAGRVDAQTVLLSAAVPLGAGGHSVGIELRRISGAARVILKGRHTQTMFVPFGNGGTAGQL